MTFALVFTFKIMYNNCVFGKKSKDINSEVQNGNTLRKYP